MVLINDVLDSFVGCMPQAASKKKLQKIRCFKSCVFKIVCMKVISQGGKYVLQD